MRLGHMRSDYSTQTDLLFSDFSEDGREMGFGGLGRCAGA